MKITVEIPDGRYCDNGKKYCPFFTFGISEGWLCSYVGEQQGNDDYNGDPEWYYHIGKHKNCPNPYKPKSK